MFKAIFSKIIGYKAEKKDNSSKFSKFFRTASAGEKKKVFLDVARKASKEQLDLIRSVQNG